MALYSGRLRHRVRIEQRELQYDTSGEAIQDPEDGATLTEWVLYREAWAAVEPLSGKEFIQSQATQSQVSTRMVVRYDAGLSPAMRIQHRGQYYEIVAVLPDRDSGLEYVTLMCNQLPPEIEPLPMDGPFITDGSGLRLTDGSGALLTWN